MKVGRDAQAGCRTCSHSPKAIGGNVELFVDANGGYTRKQALAMAERFAGESNVVWFEEPRPSDDLDGFVFCATEGRRGWTSPPANMATRPIISSVCWPPARWIAFRRM